MEPRTDLSWRVGQRALSVYFTNHSAGALESWLSMLEWYLAVAALLPIVALGFLGFFFILYSSRS